MSKLNGSLLALAVVVWGGIAIAKIPMLAAVTLGFILGIVATFLVIGIVLEKQKGI